MSIDNAEFRRLAAAGYNKIPLVREVLADFDTPLSTYRKLADDRNSYLLESVHGGEQWGRYSIIGLPCRRVVETRGDTVCIRLDGEIVEEIRHVDPLGAVKEVLNRYRVPDVPGVPRFSGGLVGYFAYDIVRFIETRLAGPQRPDPDIPDIRLLLSDEVVVFDNLSGRVFFIVHVDPAGADAWAAGQERLAELVDQLQVASPSPAALSSVAPMPEDRFRSTFEQAEFEQAVRRCKDYIEAGDIFQVVLSQRLQTRYEASPLDLYRALRTLNPSPYLFYLNFGDFQVVGSSPEILTRLEGRRITVRPIAGTRPRGDNEEEDQAMENDLLADPKELAEHLMLVDLGRNDIGRVAKIGSVRLTEEMVIERYSHVMHIVSNVVGEIRDELDAIDVIRATFPAGTLSGAPKVRAMEIIQELERGCRGLYGGAVGYIGWNGNLDTAIAIRTALIKDSQLYLQAGAGIVADSDPETEWQETMNKAAAVQRAVALAESGMNRLTNPDR